MTEHETTTHSDLRERWGFDPVFRLFVGLLCLFCVSNLLLAFRMNNFHDLNILDFLLVGLAMGMIGAQAALHAIWTVFGTLHWAPRFAVSVFSALILYLAFVVTNRLEPDRGAAIFAEQVLLCMPLSMLAIQAPLWGLKALWRWGVFRSCAEVTSAQIRALSIRDLLLATTAIAVAIALMRCAMTLDGGTNDSEASIAMFVVFLLTAFASLLTTVTTLLATLRVRDMASGVWLITRIEAALYFGWFAFICYFVDVPPGEVVTMLIGIFFGFTVSLTAPLCYLRRCGYRLRRADIDPTHEGT